MQIKQKIYLFFVMLFALLGCCTTPPSSLPLMPVRGLCAHRGDAPAYREFRAHGGKVIYCFGNDEKSIKRVAALGFEFALTDNLNAMLPHFPTSFEGRP